MKKEHSLLLKTAIITMSFVQMGTNGIAPILADIAKAFPDASASTVQFLMTFPSFFMILFSLACAILSDRLPKKLLAMTGLALVSAGGILACLFHGSLSILFVWAAVIGIGVGMVAPIAPSLINESFGGEEQQFMLGIQNSAANVGSMLMTFFGGLLAGLGWPAGYLVYTLGLVGFVFTIVGVRAEKPVKAQTREQQGERPAFHLTILKEMLIAFFFLICYSAIPTNIAMLVTEKGFGNAATSGTMSTLFLLGGMLMGFVYGRIAVKLKGLTVPLGALALVVGAFTIALSPNIVVLGIGCLVGGMSISLVMPSCMSGAPKLRGYETLGSAMIMSCSTAGVFVTPLLTTITAQITGSPATAYRFITIALLGLCLSIAGFIVRKK